MPSRGSDRWWMLGVDVSTLRVALAAIPRGRHPDHIGPEFTTVEIPNEHRSSGVEWEPPDLNYMRIQTTIAVQRLQARQLSIGLAWVEQPTGSTTPPKLLYAVGAVICGIQQALPSTPVYTIPVMSWKKASVGKGNAEKWEIIEWAQKHGLQNSDSDLADALGVAVGGAAQVASGA